MRSKSDRYTQDYLVETKRDLDRTIVTMFLCGPGQPATKRRTRLRAREDIRTFLRKKIYSELARCEVKFGEHQDLIRAFRSATGKAAANLADHELSLARRRKMDLVIIFPCSPGSFAELGMFSMTKKIASKMIVFVDHRHRNKKSYLSHGPIKAAQLRSARVYFVDYADRARIWARVKSLVQEQKAVKRGARLFGK
jgi:hypothetical protein